MSKRPKDPDAFERKIRPIYDALDSRNWKGALKLCQQAMQKYPDNELVKVLKAIGLERSGRREEANQVVDEVAASAPLDEQVLRLAAMVMRASGHLSDITVMYEKAAAAAAAAPHGAGGELALVLQHEVFGAHVRESNYVKQQQVALRLGKLLSGAAASPAMVAGVSGERYGWWVIMSILLQARAALRAQATGAPAPAGQVPAVALGPEKLLALAEGMISRQASKDGRLEGYEALMVYVDVLLAQGKVSEAQALVSGPLGAAAIRLPSERLQLRAVLSALSGDLAAAATLLREGLVLNPDDWGALLLLLDCMLPGTTVAAPARTRQGSKSSVAEAPASFTPQHPLLLISGGLAEQLPPVGVPVPSDGGASAEAFSQAEVALRELVALGAEAEADPSSSGASAVSNGAANGGKAMIMRGPDLALVDLAMRRHLVACTTRDGGTNDTEAAVVDAILSYIKKYGSLVSCAVDLRPYVSRLSAPAADRLAAALHDEVDAAAASMTAAGVPADSRAALALLRRRVCAVQIRDDLGLPRLATIEECVAFSKELLDLYSTAQPLEEGLDERERGAADELPVLAASALVTAATLAPTDAAAVPYLLAAYGALSDAVRQRPFGAGMRISLAALATLLAAPGAAATHLYKLDIKHIQLDTLGGHLLLPALLAWPTAGAGAAAAAEQSQQQQSSHVLQRALNDTRALFEDHARDAGETLFTAYNHGMYTKVLEFTAFRERLAGAHTLAVVRAEAAVAECLKAGSSSSSSSSSSSNSGGAPVDSASPDAMRAVAAAVASNLQAKQLPAEGSLRFNWDLSTRPAWLPPGAASPSLQVVEWWRSRAAGDTKGQGYGRRWWSATSSAEGPSPTATAWRAAQASTTAHRWLLPHCIAGALGAPGQEVQGLRDAVERLRGLMGPQAGEGSRASSSSLAGVDDLRQLDISLYGTALAVQESLVPVSQPQQGACSSSASANPTNPQIVSDAAANTACSALATLAADVRSIADAAAAGVVAASRDAVAWGGLLPGSCLGVVSHLVQEPLPILAACLQSWQSALKALRKRRARAGVPLEDAAQRLGDALAVTAASVAVAARACGDALAEAAAAAEPAALAANVLRFLKAQDHAAPVLSEAAAAALQALSSEQRSSVVASLVRQAAVVVAALS